MKLLFSSSLVLCFIISSCVSSKSSKTSSIAGYWVHDVSYSSNSEDRFVRAEEFDEFTSGFHLLEDGNLQVRQNSGWCGTPPISYANYDGTWKLQEANVLKMDYDYWGGKIHQTWSVKEVTDSSLIMYEVSIDVKRKKDL